MIDIWHLIVTFHQSFTDDMHRLLGEALMWPVLGWTVWMFGRRLAAKGLGKLT